MKFGIEVEGRLKGILTLFMNAEEAVDFFNHESLKKRTKTPNVGHLCDTVRAIYITDHSNWLEPSEKCLKIWQELNLPVTIEVKEIPVNRGLYPSNVSFMLSVMVPEHTIVNMRNTDQIKIHTPANMVCAATIGSMVRTNPEEFAGDIELEF